LSEDGPLTGLTLTRYFGEIAASRALPTSSDAQRAILDALERWGHDLAAELGLAEH